MDVARGMFPLWDLYAKGPTGSELLQTFGQQRPILRAYTFRKQITDDKVSCKQINDDKAGYEIKREPFQNHATLLAWRKRSQI